MLQSEALSHSKMCRRMLFQQDPVLLIHSPAPCPDDPNTCEGKYNYTEASTQHCINQ